MSTSTGIRFFFFFFQAEDGIRDIGVTGVQTCALPIYHRLRWFAGADDRLPTDAHELLALVAPRPLLLSVAVNDQVESTWAVERALDALGGVRALAGGTDPAVLWRPGGHEIAVEAVERHLDWAEEAL